VAVSLRFVAVTVLLVLLTMVQAGPARAADVPSAGGPNVDSLSFDSNGRGCVIGLKTSSPVPRFSLRTAGLAPGETVLELPEATSRLSPRYPGGPCPLREVLVEAAPGGKQGVKLRFILRSGVFAGVDRVADGLSLTFESAPPGGAAGPSGDSHDEYRVGVGDKLEIVVFGHEDMNKVVEVRGDSTINYPLLGNLPVAGKSVAEVDDEITRLLAKDFLVDPQVSVEIREYQSQWVTIIGEVRTPGRFVLRRDMRLIDLLAEAGGATKEAGMDILVTRRQEGDGAPQPLVISRDRLMSRNNQDANIVLAHGDIVTISEKEAFYIRGEVTKPGSYYLENDMTILKAISVAGGLTQFANRKSVDLLREGSGGMQKRLKVDLKAIEDGKKGDIPLLPNDVIIVSRRIF
jgi:polysaccharide export outer membrane protein